MGRGAAVTAVIAAHSLDDPPSFGLSGFGGILGITLVEVVALSEGSVPPSVRGGCAKRDDDEAFGGSRFDSVMGPSTVTTGSIAA